jgi:hypothetical protein
LTFSCTCWTIAVTVHLPSYATRIPALRVPTIKNICNGHNRLAAEAAGCSWSGEL